MRPVVVLNYRFASSLPYDNELALTLTAGIDHLFHELTA